MYTTKRCIHASTEDEMEDHKRYGWLFPWVGITDFATPQQAQMMADYYLGEMFVHKMHERSFMVGVMMSYKTLHELPTKWENAWVRKEELNKVFLSYRHVLNTLHYADFDGLSTEEDLIVAAMYGGCNLDAIQFDMIWPAPSLLESLRKRFPGLFFILQVNAHAFEMVNNSPGELVARLGEYDGVLNGVLLDKSMGKGLGLDAGYLHPFVAAVVERVPRLTVGVAGGLGPDTLKLLEPLREFFPILAIDAQGRLRKSGNSLDPIDWDLGKTYISRALSYLKSSR